jgi:hypothetical protein
MDAGSIPAASTTYPQVALEPGREGPFSLVRRSAALH